MHFNYYDNGMGELGAKVIFGVQRLLTKDPAGDAYLIDVLKDKWHIGIEIIPCYCEDGLVEDGDSILDVGLGSGNDDYDPYNPDSREEEITSAMLRVMLLEGGPVITTPMSPKEIKDYLKQNEDTADMDIPEGLEKAETAEDIQNDSELMDWLMIEESGPAIAPRFGGMSVECEYCMNLDPGDPDYRTEPTLLKGRIFIAVASNCGKPEYDAVMAARILKCVQRTLESYEKAFFKVTIPRELKDTRISNPIAKCALEYALSDD